jgi:hypothetical protein
VHFKQKKIPHNDLNEVRPNQHPLTFLLILLKYFFYFHSDIKHHRIAFKQQKGIWREPFGEKVSPRQMNDL